MVQLDPARLDDVAAEVLTSGAAPSVALAVTDRDRTLLARTYGAAAPDVPWPVASIGKSFTAVIAPPITLHHLLTHTAGVIASSDLAPGSTYDVVALAETETGFVPGEHRHLSDVGYRAVGVVLESVTRRPYPELLQERILDHLGMRSSTPVMVHETRRRLPGGHVPFYDDRPWRREHGLAPAPWVESAEADGCLCCTAEDLAAYLRALWTGSDLLSPSSLAAMKTAFPPHGPDDAPYGYGLDIYEDGFGHGGDMLGYLSYMRADTRAGVGVIAFANGFAGAGWVGEAALAIASGREPSHPDLEAGERLVETPIAPGAFRVGEHEWSPERLLFDTVIDRRAQRAVYSGTPYYRAFEW
jgi:CubicO group peptidase (beta-lactamase class C family)